MVKLTMIIGIILLALIFEKSPTWGIFAIGIYLIIRFKRRRFNSNKGLIDSAEHNTNLTINAMNEGFQTIAEAIQGREDEEDYFDEEKGSGAYLQRRRREVNIFKN